MIVIQTRSSGRTDVKRIFDAIGIIQGEHYLFFHEASQEMLDLLQPGTRQLVFTSHHPGFDARDVANSVKHWNPEAVVFALTTSTYMYSDLMKLDGVIRKTPDSTSKLACDVARSFLAGTSNEELVQMITRK